MRFTLADVAAATAGEVMGGEPAVTVEGVSIDSRTLDPGALFAALRAERDGHDFLPDALAAGAAAALVERVPEGLELAAVRVTSVHAALTDLARHGRDRLTRADVVGITGSTGKTSTKDLTRAALAARGTVHASPGSFNNELGVPLTLLNAPDDADAVVLEMGARGAGHIAELAALARPKVGVVTNVGPAHLELFGSVDAVADAKGELLEALPPDGTAVVGETHEWVEALVARARCRVVRVGEGEGADVRVSGLRVDSELRASFDLDSPWGSARIGLEMRGAHQAMNAALAATVALVLGGDLDTVADGLGRARGSQWRMEVGRSPSGTVVLNDAYNANPTSMAAALRSLASLDVPGRRWAVLGPMAELGDFADDEHRAMGALAAELGVDVVVAVGNAAGPLAEGARTGGGEVVAVPDAEAALDAVAGVAGDDAVLVKASRVAGLERVAAALLGEAGA